MRDLRAQVTSSLLRFPEGTLQALVKHEVTQGSVLRRKFSGRLSDLAQLARAPHLEIVNLVTGQRLSAYYFRGAHEQPPTIRVVKEFLWEKRTGLMIALEEGEGSVLCLYDLETSRVVKAVVLPARSYRTTSQETSSLECGVVQYISYDTNYKMVMTMSDDME
ncbi:protein ELYS-like [Cuculus canorus]|uniref:protein ELYS-like n=1 Tax=Cuculus canorus TaxID=55661 RepID=UPI0023AA315A|nr:protein ELYS-like [Cuculus canorus]